ncbi:MAG: hypothetical protein JWR26_4914 [Pedosphaera sp.]|nr:hypothetical protein [Pedosphaera sp.]
MGAVGKHISHHSIEVLRRQNVRIKFWHDTKTMPHLRFYCPARIRKIIQRRTKSAFTARMTHGTFLGKHLLAMRNLRIGNHQRTLNGFPPPR